MWMVAAKRVLRKPSHCGRNAVVSAWASQSDVGLSGLEASVELRHHRPRSAGGVGQHNGVDVNVAVAGRQGTDPSVTSLLVQR